MSYYGWPPFEITHLGNITDVGLPIALDDFSAPRIANDGTLVKVDKNRVLRIVIFRPGQLPLVVRPRWRGATGIDAAVYSPQHRCLATRTETKIQVYQMPSDRNLWGERLPPPLVGEYDYSHRIIFFKWLRPTCLVTVAGSYLYKCEISSQGNPTSPILLFPLDESVDLSSRLDVVSTPDDLYFAISSLNPSGSGGLSVFDNNGALIYSTYGYRALAFLNLGSPTKYALLITNLYPLLVVKASTLLATLSDRDLATFSERIASEPKYSAPRKMLLTLRGPKAANLLDRLIGDRDHNFIPSPTLRLIQDISSASEELPLSLWVPENEVTVDPFGDLGHGGEARVFRCERYIDGWRWPMATACREALTHYLLSHGNILRLHGVFFHRGSFMTLLPLVENQYSSRSCISSPSPSASSLHFLRSVHEEERGDLTSVTLKILHGATAGIEYMHGRDPPVIHGDIHPENVLVTATGEAMLCDFGLSRIHHDVTRTATNILEGGHRRYVAPELVNSASERFRTTKSSDIYSLGMTFYSLITLDVPFQNLRDYDAMHQINNGRRPGRPKTSTILADSRIQAAIWVLIKEMWAHKPATRPTAADVLRRVHSTEDILRVGPHV
ncbi:kinase-like protein [Clavulina sp. PMI_390]|nr:kinase-like protein [Clavulina sp. PMI_390]